MVLFNEWFEELLNQNALQLGSLLTGNHCGPGHLRDWVSPRREETGNESGAASGAEPRGPVAEHRPCSPDSRSCYI